MDCFGTYFTHVQTCNVTRVQSATEWTASVHTLHMSKKLLWTWQPAHMEHTKYTAARLLKTCTWQPAHMEHAKCTAVRTKVHIQQNHSACTDEALTCDPRKRVHSRPPDPWKWMVGILVSFWDGLFSGAMLVSGRVECEDAEQNLEFSRDAYDFFVRGKKGTQKIVFQIKLPEGKAVRPCKRMIINEFRKSLPILAI